MKFQVVFLVAMLLGSTVAFWQVPLHKTEVKKASDVLDELHVAEIELGNGDNSKKVKSTFDSTILFNWFLDQNTKIMNSGGTLSTNKNSYYQCKAPCEEKGDISDTNSLIYINGDRFSFKPLTNTRIGAKATNKLEIAGKGFAQTDFLRPDQIDEEESQQIFESSEVMSLGLGRPDYVVLKQSNFADRINQTVRLPQIGFSLYIHSTLSQIIFGEANGFFAKKHPLTRIRNLEKSKNWQTRIVKLVVGKRLVVGADSPIQCFEKLPGNSAPTAVPFPTSLPCTDPPASGASGPAPTILGHGNPAAIFDTTTRYIYGPVFQVEALQKTIKEYKSEIVIQNGFFACNEATYKEVVPSIDFYFYEHADVPFTVLAEDYIRVHKGTAGTGSNHPNDKCEILIKSHPSGYRQVNQLNWYLGTSFLANNYCHFAQKDNSINCSPAFRFTPGELHIGSNSRVAALVAGILILLAALALLISLFTKVPPFQPSSVAVPIQNSKSVNLPRTQIESTVPANNNNNNLFQSTNTNNIYNSRFPQANSNSYYQR